MCGHCLLHHRRGCANRVDCDHTHDQRRGLDRRGLFWSVIAGGAGALGALGIILAFNAGGKPIYVMPLVFGFAPVINTFISLTEAGTWSEVQTMFWVSLGVVIAGAITVLTTAPKAAHGPAHAAPAGAK